MTTRETVTEAVALFAALAFALALPVAGLILSGKAIYTRQCQIDSYYRLADLNTAKHPGITLL